MSDWLKAILGVDNADIPEGAVTRFEFANLPSGTAGLLLALLALVLIAGVFWVYRREGSTRLRVKLGLGALRAFILVAIFVLILEPVLAVDQVEEVERSTLVMLDASLSMTTRDRYTEAAANARLGNALGVDPTRMLRYELVNRALDKSELIYHLTANNRVVVYTFADGIGAAETFPHRSADEPAAPLAPLDLKTEEARRAGARGTNLAGSIRQAVEAVGSERIAAIVVVSDGRNNLGPPAADLAQYLRNKDLRLHTVAVGESEPPRNLRVIALAGPDRIYRNDPATFEVRVGAQGYNGATVVLERHYTDGSDDWENVGNEPVAFPGPDQPVVVNFNDRPPRVGTLEYRARMEVEPGESNRRDNEKTFVTRVIEEKAKVLLVSGAPAHEYYAIKNTLLRDSTIELASFLQSADPEFPQDGNIHLDELPKTQEDLFKFDVVILHDPDGDAMPPDWPALLKKFVSDHRGGLCFIAGNKNTLSLVRTKVGENDLTGILPVVLDLDSADQPGTGIGYGGYFDSPWRMQPEAAALTHPTTRFHSDPRRARELVWERLPPFYWCFPVQKAKPGATVLARHDDPRQTVEPYGRRPVLAVQRFGGGRVMFLAADETHRWRSVAENVFDRFWVQTVRYLVEGRHAGARRRFRIFLDRELVDLGDAVRVNAEVFDEKFEPLQTDEGVEVLVNGPAGLEETVRLLPSDNREGHYSGSFAPPAEGDYELRAAAKEYRPAPAEGPDMPAATFRAELPHREMGDVRTDFGLLGDLARRTRGRALGLHEIERLAERDLIPPRTEKVVTQGKPIPLWDTWTTIIVILGLLCAEWVLRKMYRMV
jgi:hypothetical protein